SGVERAGLPALALPCGFAHGMPVGLQLIAPRWRENDLLSLAYAYECLVGPPAPARMRDVDSMNRF
ncbi:MAG: amidase family protein, partial [Oscillospiraceae bacterium]|nr:amidase family protein [Oscillospiraceae bacterium]